MYVSSPLILKVRGYFFIECLPGTLSFELDLHKCGIVKVVK